MPLLLDFRFLGSNAGDQAQGKILLLFTVYCPNLFLVSLICFSMFKDMNGYDRLVLNAGVIKIQIHIEVHIIAGGAKLTQCRW